jgi:hypothetical protein
MLIIGSSHFYLNVELSNRMFFKYCWLLDAAQKLAEKLFSLEVQGREFFCEAM